MVLKYVIAANPTYLDQMIVKIWEAQSDEPGAEVFTEIIPERNGAGVPTPGAGHQVPYVLTANGLDTVVHVVRLYDNDGNELHKYNAETKVDTVTIFDPIQFKIGDEGENTPDADTNVYQNDLLIGLEDTDYYIQRNGYGLLFPNLHYEVTPLDGAWNLLGEDVFGDGEEFTIIRKSKVLTTVVNDSVVGKWFKDVQDVAADRAYTAADLRKLLRFVGTCKYTFAADSVPPKGYGFVFQHFGAGAANSVGTVEFLNAPLLWNNTTKASIDIPLYCQACFVFDGVAWNVVYLTQSTWVNAGAAPAGTTMGIGELYVGNIQRQAWLWQVTHNLAIAGDYHVFLSARGTSATAAADTNVTLSWRHNPGDKPNTFYFITREPENVSSLNDLTICWLIIKR